MWAWVVKAQLYIHAAKDPRPGLLEDERDFCNVCVISVRLISILAAQSRHCLWRQVQTSCGWLAADVDRSDKSITTKKCARFKGANQAVVVTILVWIYEAVHFTELIKYCTVGGRRSRGGTV